MDSPSSSLQFYWEKMAKQAKKASIEMNKLSTAQKNFALNFIAEAIFCNEQKILSANALDLTQAKNNNLQDSFVDRLTLTRDNLSSMVTSIQQIIELPDPIGEVSNMHYRPSGIQVGKIRTPLGVICSIYESRPNVTIDSAILCFKSGNACILRGGKEAIHSNQALMQCIYDGLSQANIDINAIQLVEKLDYELVSLMVQSPKFVDVVIPRGGKNLIQAIIDKSSVPVIKHLDGNCHIFIDETAIEKQAIDLTVNSKTRRYGVCNALEKLLVHKNVADKLLPTIVQQLTNKGVLVKGCEKTKQLIDVKSVNEDDWHMEYLDAIIAIKVVDDIEQAINHINQYGSAHTDAIVTQNVSNMNLFIKLVDSSSVMVNAATSFADGFEYGLGAEIGISTDKIHARGPVGLQELTSQKYIVFGDGHIRS